MGDRLKSIGMHIARYGLAIVLLWIGGMKFTAYEAEGIKPLVANSPLMGSVYRVMSVGGFSSLLGVVEIAIGVLIALRPVWAMGSAVEPLRSLHLMSYLQRRRFLAVAATTPTLMDQEPAEGGRFPSGLVTTRPHRPPRRCPGIAAACHPTPVPRPPHDPGSENRAEIVTRAAARG